MTVPPLRRPLRGEKGAGALEYVGMVLIAAFVVTLVFAAVAPQRLKSVVSSAVCVITTGESCGSGPGGPGTKPWEEMTPFERATWGRPWFMGDSYASGEGAGDYQEGTDDVAFNPKNPLTYGEVDWVWVPHPTLPGVKTPVPVPRTQKNLCHRSGNSYQSKTFDRLQQQGAFSGQTYSTEACSGAVGSDLYQDNHNGNHGEGPQAQRSASPNQDSANYDAIPPDASLIQMSMGGNDLGFGSIVSDCVMRGSKCGTSEDDPATQQVRDDIARVYGTPDKPGELEKQVAEIRKKHPHARIVIMGYPSLFAEKGLVETSVKTGKKRIPGTNIEIPTISVDVDTNGQGALVTKDRQKWANQRVVDANKGLEEMCQRAGCEFIDPTPAFVGEGYDHRIGSDDPWINGISALSPTGDYTINQESVHPNAKGHEAQTELLYKHIVEGPKK